MGLDLYAGTLSRYYSHNWKTIVPQWAEENWRDQILVAISQPGQPPYTPWSPALRRTRTGCVPCSVGLPGGCLSRMPFSFRLFWQAMLFVELPRSIPIQIRQSRRKPRRFRSAFLIAGCGLPIHTCRPEWESGTFHAPSGCILPLEGSGDIPPGEPADRPPILSRWY